MLILGITSPISWNPAACLLRDGELIAFVEEERLSRVKHAPHQVPTLSIAYCLQEAGVKLNEIQRIAVGFSSVETLLAAATVDFARHPARAELRYLLWTVQEVIGRHIGQGVWGNWPFPKNDRRIRWIRHHLAHVASAYYVSGFSAANVVSLDGWGGQEAGLLGVGRGLRFEVVARIPPGRSWGVFYERITGALGFRRHSDEGKVMGLAAYGVPDPTMSSIVDWSGPVPLPIPERVNEFVRSIPPRGPNGELSDAHKNAAATAQDLLEKAVLDMCRYLERTSGLRDVCVSGGTGLNCSLNGKILTSGLADRVFIQPANSDAGSALGAAIQVQVSESRKSIGWSFKDPYLGPSYSNEQVEDALLRAKITTYCRSDDICSTTASLLAQNKLVGWLQGRMEVGPRALGNRSILANAANPAMRDIVNNQVKGREPWRPFAPSLRLEDAPNVYEGGHPSPFMILAFPARDDQVARIPSAIHVDGTCRPQTVDRNVNPRYWELISKFKGLTGIPVVLNTSFNLAGEPIVCSPEDALSTFFRCGLDYLVMNDFLVWK